MNTRLAASTAAALLVGLVPVTPAAADTPTRPRTTTATASRPQYTSNWAGYVRQQSGTREASAQWRVPKVRTGTNGSASTWVGIDGNTNPYLAQVGTANVVKGRRVTTYAWWEVVSPTSDTTMRRLSLTVRQGDLVRAQVRIDGRTARLSLRNLTTGRSSSVNAAFRGPGMSAEWIQEGVNVDGYISPAVRWSPVTFTRLTRNGVNPALRPTERLDILDGYGVRETRTSLPGRSSFTVTRLAAGHWTRSD